MTLDPARGTLSLMAPLAVGSLVPKEVVSTRHPKWSEWIDRWQFFRHSHDLTGPYAAVLSAYTGPDAISPQGESMDATGAVWDSYLVPHEKETAYEFQRRVKEARCPRFVQQGIASMVGVLSQRSARRDGYPDKVREWLDWVDSAGSTWDLFVQNALLPMVLRYGIGYVFPHRPALKVQTQAQAEEAGLPPVVLDVVSPEALVAWEIDEFERMTWVRYYEEICLPVGPTAELQKPIKRYWTIDRYGWWAVDDLESAVVTVKGDDGREREYLRVVDSGYWDGSDPEQGTPDAERKALFLAAPVAAVAFEGWHSPTETASLAQLEYFRVASELRKLGSSTAFSMLACPVTGDSSSAAEILKGPDQVLTYPSDAKSAPTMLSPDSGPFEHYRQQLADLKIESLLPYGIMGTDGVSSGIALAQVEHQSSHLYRVTSRVLSQGEYAVMELVAPLLGTTMPPESRAEWPTEFGALSSTKQIADLVELATLTSNPEVKIDLVCKAVDICLPDLSDDRRQEVRESIEETIHADAEAQADLQRAAEEAMLNPEAGEAPPAAGGSGATTMRPKAMEGEPSSNPGA